MKFKVGDIIVFKHEKQCGTILKIVNGKLLVKNSDGFEEIVSSNDIILYDENTDKVTAYGIDFDIKDNQIKKRKTKKNQRFSKVLKIDLHIELIIDYYKELENHEIVNIQLKKCENAIRKAMNTRIEKIIIVHGIGVGTLKKEVHQLLDQYNFRYYTSQDGGSTEVML
ncbi:MAG: hypothetical protein CM15mP112_09070 [Flavobacteriales bacterium]|nr:MAG: hypothetical protein CM15mP112_09070 [Flavobacteriales bacterium]